MRGPFASYKAAYAAASHGEIVMACDAKTTANPWCVMTSAEADAEYHPKNWLFRRWTVWENVDKSLPDACLVR